MQYLTKVDIIYDSLMKKIASGECPCGERLNIRQIAKDNNISEIPVREAIRRLESEGFVTVRPNQGATVNSLSDMDVLEIFHLKGLLEGYAARLAIDVLTEKDYAVLRFINQELKDANENGNLDLCAELNVKFHMYMYNALHHTRLIEMISDLWRKWQITKTVFRAAPDRSSHSVQEHEEILQLMEAKKYDETEMCVRNHKYSAGYELAEYIKKHS